MPMNDFGDQLFRYSGHNRLAWFILNFILLRNGLNPFYFKDEEECSSVIVLTDEGMADEAQDRLLA